MFVSSRPTLIILCVAVFRTTTDGKKCIKYVIIKEITYFHLVLSPKIK